MSIGRIFFMSFLAIAILAGTTHAAELGRPKVDYSATMTASRAHVASEENARA